MRESSVYAAIKLAGYSSDTPVIVNSRFQASAGELCLLTGPSGSGKTVFLYSITGVLKHFLNGVVEGEVELYGLNPLIYSNYIKLPSILGFIMQDPERQIIYPTPLDEAIAVLEARGYSYEEAYRKALNVLGALGLLGKINEHVENLSGGEKKRLAITLSIIHDPELLILDEPSASLDPEGILFVKNLINEKKRENHTVIVTEHKRGYFMDIVDKTYVLVKHSIQPLSLEAAMNFEKQPYCSNLPHAGGEIILETRGLAIGYREPLVKNIDIYLRRGEIVALVGPNGSGKSTLLKTLSGFLKPIEGEVVLKDRRIFYAPQNPDLMFIHGSVEKELKDTSRKTGVNIEDLYSMYPWFQSVRRLHPLRLSHGQRRWLALLIAYAYARDILLLDEPTTGLDYTLYNNLVKLLTMLRSRGISIILSTHDPRLIADVADRVYVVRNGDVHEEEKCRVVEAIYREIGVSS